MVTEKEQEALELIQKIDRQYLEMAEEKDRTIQDLVQQRDSWQQRAENAERQYQAVVHSSLWRATKPLRWLARGVRAVLGVLFSVPPLRRFSAWLAACRRLGSKTVRFNKAYYGTLDGPVTPLVPGAAEMQREIAQSAAPDILFSIVAPLYNPAARHLEAMLHSVCRQSYGGWQLCLADAGENGAAEEIVRKYAAKDGRILYKKLPAGSGMAACANAAMAMATGGYIGLLGQEGILNLNALYEMHRVIVEEKADFLYSDEAILRGSALSDIEAYALKPDFAPDTLRSLNYIGHFAVFKGSLLEKAGGPFREEYNDGAEYDMVLRLTEKAGKIVHVPRILYFGRADAAAQAEPSAAQAAEKAVAAQLERLDIPGTVERVPGSRAIRHVRYAIKGDPLVSIVIPNKDEVETLRACLNSILEKTTWQNYEIILCENNSTDPATFAYYEELVQRPHIRRVTWEGAFNYSAINNFAAGHARGDYLILLNNDTEIITPGWIEEMLMFCQRPEVGAVGAKLYYPDETVQHAGTAIGIFGIAGHTQLGHARCDEGYMGSLNYARNVSCVTAACMMVRKAVFTELGGLNPEFAVAFNDVDLCMRIRAAGYLILFTPFAELYHFESKSRGYDTTPENYRRFMEEARLLKMRWEKEIYIGDPYHNANLRLDTTEYVADPAKLAAPQ